MKHGWLRRTLILLIAVGLCAGMVFYSRRETKSAPKSETLTLWYAQEDCSDAAMESLIARCRKETGIQIKTMAFANEAFLAAAFEGMSGAAPELPDLLFCSHVRAAVLDERMGLAEIAESLPLSSSLAEVCPTVGKSFFPIGSRLPMMLVNTSLTDADFDSFEALLFAAGDDPFLGCDCWAELLYTEAAAKGIRLTGETEQSFGDTQIAALYNKLAMSVFRGGLVCTENPAEYVRQGLLPCAISMSSSLAGFTDKTLSVRLLPLPEGAETRYPAELMGFALLSSSRMDAAVRFFHWLWSGPAAGAAVEAGLAPIMMTSGTQANSELEKCLYEVSEKVPLFLLEPEEPFVQNRTAFERWLRETLDLLN